MSDELRAAQQRLQARVPVSIEDAAALRAEVRAADAALGAWLRRSATAAADSGAPRAEEQR